MENILIINMNFDEFWKSYPRKVAKFVAKKSWGRLTKKEIKTIKTVLSDHKLRWQDKELQYIPHASTWLNQKRFDDELEPLPEKKITLENKEQMRMQNLKKEWEEAEKNAASPDEIRAALGLQNKDGSS